MSLDYRTPSTSAGPGSNDLAQDRVVYVGNAGNDANPGTSINLPKKTPASAFTAATALTPTAQFPVTVQAVDGFKYTGTITVPSFVKFKCSVFEGKIILGIQSVAEIGIHYGVNTITEMVEVPASVVDAQYICTYWEPRGYDQTVVGMFGFKLGNDAYLSVRIMSAKNNGSVFQTADASSLYFEIGELVQWNDGAALGQFNGQEGSMIGSVGSMYDGDGSVTNSRVAVFPGGNQNNAMYLSGGFIQVNAGVQWLAADTNALTIYVAAFDGSLDYANGILTTFWPGLIANSNTTGLLPAPDGTGTKKATDTSPATYT